MILAQTPPTTVPIDYMAPYRESLDQLSADLKAMATDAYAEQGLLVIGIGVALVALVIAAWGVLHVVRVVNEINAESKEEARERRANGFYLDNERSR